MDALKEAILSHDVLHADETPVAMLYLKDVFTRLPTQPANQIDELLPHHWSVPSSA